MIICSHSWRAGRAAVLSNLFEMSIIWDIARQVTPSREVTTRTTGVERCHPNVSDMLPIAIQHVILQEWMKIQVLRYQTYILMIFSEFREPKVTQRCGADTSREPRAPKSRRLSLLVDCSLRSIICLIPSQFISIIPSFQLRNQVTV